VPERRFIGRCGLRINPTVGSGDIGYWIDGDYEGRGLVTRAAEALISRAFEERALNRMELRTCVDNSRSRTVAERLGFTFEGILARGLHFRTRAEDVALYGVSARDWSMVPRRGSDGKDGDGVAPRGAVRLR
jgi:ribosomal-protein-serine acetyltransferase